MQRRRLPPALYPALYPALPWHHLLRHLHPRAKVQAVAW
jgi:hypothetical protein